MNKGVVGVLSLLTGAAAGAIGAGKITGAKINEKQQISDKHLSLFLMMNQWVKVKQSGKNLSAYFEQNGYKKIAIYGMSYAGETLLEELSGSSIEVAYGIDKRAEHIYADVDIVTMDDMLGDVDAIVVTAVTFFDAIEEALAEKIDCPVISLEDILYEV